MVLLLVDQLYGLCGDMYVMLDVVVCELVEMCECLCSVICEVCIVVRN